MPGIAPSFRRLAVAILSAAAFFPGAVSLSAIDARAPAIPGFSEESSGPVRASLSFDLEEAIPGSPFHAILVLEHREGWHSYGKTPGGTGYPTAVEWSLPDGLTAGEIEWPAPEAFTDGGVSSSGYSGRAEFRIPMVASKTLAPGSILSVDAKVSWLACEESCFPGGASFHFDLPVGKARPSPASSLLLAILGALAGGLLLNLMPCVLPVLSIKLHGLMLDASSPGKTPLGRGLAYGAGVVLSFWALAGLIVALKAGGKLLGWGFQFQDPGFVAAMSVFLAAFALNMLGVFEIGAGAAALADGGVRGKGLARAFLSGVFASLAATPCAAPFSGSAIGYALGAGAAESFAVFGALGSGLAAPVVLVSAFPRLLARLPKAGKWSQTLQSILGFALMGTVVWLLSILSSLTGGKAVVSALWSILGVSAAAWIWGRWGGSAAKRPVRIASAAVALALFVSCLLFAAISAERNAGRGGARIDTADAAPAGRIGANGIRWEPYSRELLDRLRAEGSPVFIDFGADWCLSCKTNEAAVLDTERIALEFRRRGVKALKADWTRADPEIARALASYGRRSVPLYVLYAPGREAPVILPEILSQGIVLGALESIGP